MTVEMSKLDPEIAKQVKEVEETGVKVTAVSFPSDGAPARLSISMNGMPMGQARYELEQLHYDVGNGWRVSARTS